MSRITIRRKFVSTIPRTQDTTVARLLTYAGIGQSPELWLGSRLLLASGVALLFAILPPLYSQISGNDLGFGAPPKFNLPFMFGYMLLCAGAAFAAVLGLVYFHLYYLVHDRTRRVEDVLPDFMLMVAAHMHAGLTPFSAFQSAARPEFGPLEVEVKNIASHSMGSESFTEALTMLTDHIDSPILRRTIAFFENGLRSGGKLASLLETAADEIRELDEIRKETVLSTRTYTIFLIFILVGGLPVLLGISTEFLHIFSRMSTMVDPNAMKGMSGMLSPTLSLSPEFVGSMAGVIIAATTLFVSMFLGVLMEGKILYGVKYSVPLFILAYTVYTAVNVVLAGFLGAFFT